MLINNLYDQVLLDPAKNGKIDSLFVVSGYATPSMVYDHMKKLGKIGAKITINLIIGMSKDGIDRFLIEKFQDLARETPCGQKFNCSYVISGSAVHAKTYCWVANKVPKLAFAGSANYSINAFENSQIECIAPVSKPKDAMEFYNNIFNSGHIIDCLSPNIQNHISSAKTSIKFYPQNAPHESVKLSLLTKRTRETHKKAGLNWGQRQERNNKDEAYIPVPQKIAKSGFFPEQNKYFTVHTDDNINFEMLRVQQGGKALHTPNNAFIGKYFRKRMGVASGEFVKTTDLDEYGRKDVEFTKIDDGIYFMDFSKPSP